MRTQPVFTKNNVELYLKHVQCTEVEKVTKIQRRVYNALGGLVRRSVSVGKGFCVWLGCEGK
jgi:hypothetical protein